MQSPKKILHIVDREDDESARLFWKNKSPEERLNAVEFLREQCYVIRGFKSTPTIIRKLQIVNPKH